MIAYVPISFSVYKDFHGPASKHFLSISALLGDCLPHVWYKVSNTRREEGDQRVLYRGREGSFEQ